MEGLNKNTINELKSFAKPPASCILVACAVITLFGVKSKDPWRDFKKLIADPNAFIRNLRDFDKENVPPHTLRELARYTLDEKFNADKIKMTSVAAHLMCIWVLEIEK